MNSNTLPELHILDATLKPETLANELSMAAVRFARIAANLLMKEQLDREKLHLITLDMDLLDEYLTLDNLDLDYLDRVKKFMAGIDNICALIPVLLEKHRDVELAKVCSERLDKKVVPMVQKITSIISEGTKNG